MPSKESQDFKERKKLMELQLKHDQEKHDRKMLELEYSRQNEQLHHDHEMERQRIKSAEIRKSQERKEASRYYGG